MTSTEGSDYRIVSRRQWPEGYTVAPFGRTNVSWNAGELSAIDGFEPVVMRVSLDDFDRFDDEAPGEYLLLPPEQGELFRAAVKRTIAEYGEDPSTWVIVMEHLRADA